MNSGKTALHAPLWLGGCIDGKGRGPSLPSSAGDLPCGDVQTVEEVGDGDREHQAGKCGFIIMLGGFAFAGIGLLVASRAKTVETVSGLMNLVMLPMFVLSGVFFSSDRFPDVIQPFVQALPLTALNDALRAVVLEGRDLSSQAVRIGILLGWGVVSSVLALRFFRWN